MKFSYDPILVKLARDLRNRSTLSEILLWKQLNRRQRMGFHFQRQKPMATYILDFFSHELMLAIEIDGQSHKLKGTEDEIRQHNLEKLGIRVLRFSDQEVKRNLAGVIRAIDAWIETNRPDDLHTPAFGHPSS